MSSENTKPSKADRILAFSGIFLPLVLLYLGHLYKDIESKRGIHEKYVEIALDILRDGDDSRNQDLRKWAIEVIDEYSEVPFHDDVKSYLMKSELPAE